MDCDKILIWWSISELKEQILLGVWANCDMQGLSICYLYIFSKASHLKSSFLFGDLWNCVYNISDKTAFLN